MSELNDFLDMKVVSEMTETVKVDVNGKSYEFVIRPMTEEEHTEFQSRSNTITKKSVTFNSCKYNSLVLTTCIVSPDFSNAEFLSKVKCPTAWDFLNSRFPAGTLSELVSRITKLSGFQPLEMEVEEAKN